MKENTKIATCCYCGARTILQLRARGGHELACGKCGAPLHEMKAMPVARTKPVKPAKSITQPAKYTDPKYTDTKPRKSKRKSRKTAKGIGYWIGEALEEIVDIFD